MHGTVKRDSESCKSLRRSNSQHMRPVLPSATTETAAGDNHSPIASSIKTSTTGDSFFKDGRKITVGDCALFKPPKSSPPSIGLIRWLAFDKEKKLKLGVNWLYRSSELKLGKGHLLDTAPNEIFYSFHKDETSAAYLLHPCKVAFLPKGVELPVGTAAFVCRRAYDISNKRLWWLTDQDCFNEQQEEVDQLLFKTKTEMHVTLQPGGRSPKQVNGPTSTSQLKSASDDGQNNGNSFHSQARGKKRERGDHAADPVKRERSSSRIDDGDLVQLKTESSLKNEIARITEKGGVVDFEGVDKLVQLMQLDEMDRKIDLVNGMERKIDLASRSMLTSVMASTEKDGCLNRFVQLKGLSILDEWLQDIQKGKVVDCTNPKDCDKYVEEFLLVLLSALDKLPVNLHALQMCNIGRSVNHLRTHKNVEIQRKARSLVDTWKKRVEAEMNMIDAKSTQATDAWPSKSRLPEASHGGRKTSSGSDTAMKSSISQNSAVKTTSVRSSHGESIIKYASSSPGAVKHATSFASGKDNQPNASVGGSADAPQIREDRSSSSNQSHSYGQSVSVKDDTKSFTSGLATVNKTSSSSARNRKLSGSPRVSACGSQKENSSSKISSAHNNSALEKLSQSSLTNERVVEGHKNEGSSHKLIVKIPNRVRSPAHGMNEGSLEDPTLMSSRASSPVLMNESEQSDHASKEKSHTHRCIVAAGTNAWQNNDPKVEFDGKESSGSPAVLSGEEQGMASEDSKRIVEGLPTNQLNSEKLHKSSFSPMNALVESCAKYSEAASSLSIEDDVGMNLLASVAAGEMSKSDVISPADSMERSAHVDEEVCVGDEAKSESTPEECSLVVQKQFSESDCDGKKQAIAPVEFSGDRKCVASHSSEGIDAGDQVNEIGSTNIDLRSSIDDDLESTRKPNEKMGNGDDTSEGVHKEKAAMDNGSTSSLNCRNDRGDVLVPEEEHSDLSRVGECKPLVQVAGSKPKPIDQDESGKVLNDGLNRTDAEQKLTAATVKSGVAETANCEKLHQAESNRILLPEADDAEKVGELNYGTANSSASKSGRLNIDKEVEKDAADGSHTMSDLCSTSHGLNCHHKEDNVENQVIPNHISVPESRCSDAAENEAQGEADLTRSKSVSIQPEEANDYAPSGSGTASPASGETDPGTKLKFDLNEGFCADDGKYGESITSTSSGPATVQLINSLPFSVKSIPSGHSTSITVAAAAKGSFVPPQDLLKSRVELGWKGSAATSAFRPAEPRKVHETSSTSTTLSCPDVSTTKHERTPLDIDLNVPDERVLEEMTSQGSTLATGLVLSSSCVALLNEPSDSLRAHGCGGLDLDLNTVDANDAGHCSASSNPKGKASALHAKHLGSLHVGRDFDLNNGPLVDDGSAEEFPFINQLVNGGTSQLPSAGLRTNSPVMGSFSSWFPSGNSYSTMAIPSMLPERGEQPFSVFPPGATQRTFEPTGIAPFNREVFRGSVLSSSPAVPYPSSPFQLPVFPYGTSIPLPSATFSVGAASYADSSAARPFASPVNSQYLGPFGSVTSPFQRPFMVTFPGISNNSMLESNRQWSRQGLDLNSGPGALESEVREELLPLSSVQRAVSTSQGLVEEQARMFSISGGILKRKEPDGDWDNESSRRKQFSWQ
ncbi:non-specific serine/threonine protein kinase [Salvia divinorum]|uniref:Non-specific serine/threonine protein kinase n=1 Tax=Salvia divinorum TaxID=28513 RepID=A0ABD1H4B0_SALDI